jgi:UDP-N-acetyl-2-amino-2-deoxyglucuronate dehydrogenase
VTTQTLGVGIIGIGNIAPIHAAAIKDTPGTALVAAATRNEAHGRAFTAQFGGNWFADYRDLLGRADVDIVIICTPHHLHAPMTIDAAAAGKHVWCEKPMGRNLADCDAMIAACERANVKLGIVFQGRFEPLSRQLKAALDTRKLGRLLWVSSNTVWYRNDEYYRSGPWRGKQATEGGGVVINQAIHTIDLLLWLSGMPARVTAQARTLNHAIEVEDAAIAILEYADRHLGLIQATTAAYPGLPERLEFFGTLGSAVFHKGEGRLEWHLIEPREDRIDRAQASSGAASPIDTTATAHTAQFQEFVSAINEQRAPLVDGREGRRSVELVQALYRSAQTGEAVDLES